MNIQAGLLLNSITIENIIICIKTLGMRMDLSRLELTAFETNNKINEKINNFYCFIVISMEPTMASKSIIDVKINHKGKLVYIIFPILVI